MELPWSPSLPLQLLSLVSLFLGPVVISAGVPRQPPDLGPLRVVGLQVRKWGNVDVLDLT